MMKAFGLLKVLFVVNTIQQQTVASKDKSTVCKDHTTEVASCCYVLIDVINAERKQQECLKKEIVNLKKQLRFSNSDTCDDYLISGYLEKSTKLSASSEYGKGESPDRARLNTKPGHGKYGSWVAKKNDTNQYLQIDLGSLRKVVGIATQGRSDLDQWVKKFRILYSTDCKSWNYVGEGNGQIFIANKDRNTIKKNIFTHPIKARCIRINPTEWHSYVSMRADVIGCSL